MEEWETDSPFHLSLVELTFVCPCGNMRLEAIGSWARLEWELGTVQRFPPLPMVADDRPKSENEREILR